MINKKQTFVELCLNGDAFLDEIDDFIDMWHDNEDTSEEISLYDHLGMTWREYSLWVKDSDVLSSIINARKKGVDLHEELRQELQPLAARADSTEEAQKILSWLQERGEIE